MSGLSSTLPFPVVSGEATRATSKLDHRSSEEAQLVRRVQARDELAFREIVDRYQAKVFSIIYGILRNRNDAEDIAQQVFAKIYFSIKNFDFRSSLLTWIYKITVNECYDYLRKKRVRKLVYESDFSADDSQRVENSEPAVDHGPAVDQQLAQQDLIFKLAVQNLGRGSQLDPPERGGGAFGGRAVSDDRNERKYHQSEAFPGASEAGEGGGTAGQRSSYVACGVADAGWGYSPQRFRCTL